MASQLHHQGVGSILALNQVNYTRGTVEIHPYVQGRLRALPRQDETAGILLGNSEGGIIRITGFKRVTPSGLRQAAFEAGQAMVGFYRLQTPSNPFLMPEEEELWRQVHPEGRSLFLLVKPVGEGVETTAWTRENDGEPVAETVSLDGEFMERRKPPFPANILPAPRERPASPQRILPYAALALAAVLGVALLQPGKPARSLALALQSHNAGELTAVWEQQIAPEAELKFATLTILDGTKEQTMDLTRSYTPHGRITVRPQSRDIVFTLRVQYVGEPLLARGATYAGFVPGSAPPAKPTVQPVPEPAPAPAAAAPAPAAPASNAELETLRKRNKELEEAVTALRKHFRP